MLDEAPVWIAINGVRRILLACSPLNLEALAVGHLVAEAWVDGAAGIHGLRAAAGPGGAYGIELEMEPERVRAAEALRSHRLEHGCGLRHMLDCAPPQRRPHDRASVPALTAAFRALFAAAAAAAPAGVHAAALCAADGRLQHVTVDVARHSAVDRTIGVACLAGAAPSAYGLVLSSRISGAIALKAVHAGIPWVASRSIATPLAHEIAAAAGVRLHEQAARRGS
jgi:FdhD protein